MSSVHTDTQKYAYIYIYIYIYKEDNNYFDKLSYKDIFFGNEFSFL